MSGAEQSPIDLREPILAELEPLRFDWNDGPVDVEHGEHITFLDGGAIIVDGVRSVLKKGHVHRPSEHSIGPQCFDMEIHLVHEAPNKSLVVLGIFVEGSDVEHGTLGELLRAKSLPHFDPNTLLPPPPHRHYRYAGSLTTEPFSEIATWCVLQTPICGSQNQLALCPGGARPRQERNRRFVLLGG